MTERNRKVLLMLAVLVVLAAAALVGRPMLHDYQDRHHPRYSLAYPERIEFQQLYLRHNWFSVNWVGMLVQHEPVVESERKEIPDSPMLRPSTAAMPSPLYEYRGAVILIPGLIDQNRSGNETSYYRLLEVTPAQVEALIRQNIKD